MKLVAVLSLLALGSLSVSAQQPNFGSFTVDLTSGSSDQFLYVGSGSGTLKSLSCRVTTAVTGSPDHYISITVDTGTTQSITVYGVTNTFTSVAPLQTFGSSSNSGSNVGDAFTIPLNITYSSNVQVIYEKPSHASAGALACVLIYS